MNTLVCENIGCLKNTSICENDTMNFLAKPKTYGV